MPPTFARAWFRRAPVWIAASAAVLLLGRLGRAQPPTPAPPVWARGPAQPATPQPDAPPKTPPPPAGSPVIARIGGRAITQLEYDRIAQPYFQRLRAQMGAGFGSMQRLASFTVLDELLRRNVLWIEAERQKLQATPEEMDAQLRLDPFFLTNGKFDAEKFANYKSTTGSNYLEVLPQLRQAVLLQKVDAALRKRFTPSSTVMQAEWAQRNDQVRFQVFQLLAHDMPVDTESTARDWEAYYRAHPDEFVRSPRVRLRYLRQPIPLEGDSARAAALTRAMARARGIADSLQHGTLPDTSAELVDTGLIDPRMPFLPGLGPVGGLLDTLQRDSTVRILQPTAGRDAVIVGAVIERQPRQVPPLREVIADVKRRADQDVRLKAEEADRHAYYEAHRDRWRGTRARVTRLTLRAPSVMVPPVPASDVDRWYEQHGHLLFGMPDSSRTALPALNDSLRQVARARLTEDRRVQRVGEIMARIAADMRGTRDVRALARANGAVAETLSFVEGVTRDSLFSPMLIDSLLASAVRARGVVQGPRTMGILATAWRVDAVDTAFTAPYEMLRIRTDQAFQAERRAKDEAKARAWYDGHRSDYRTPLRYGLDVVAIRVPPADSVRVPEADLRRQYAANPKLYRREEEVHARHILFLSGGTDAAADRRAHARADSLLAAIREGNAGDFGDLAKRFSEEPGAASTGGELGWFGRGRMVKEFETAVFALQQTDQVSPVVKTQFGYHLIQLEGRRPAGRRPFDEVRAEIRTQMAQARGDSSAKRAAAALRRRLAAGGDAKALAAAYGGVVAATPISANDPVAGFGQAQGLAQDLPSLPAGAWARTVYRAANTYLVLRLREKQPPRPAEFEEVKIRAIEDAKNEDRRAILKRKVEILRSALAAGQPIDSLTAPLGGLRDCGFLPRSANFVPLVGNEPRLVERAFAMKPGQLSDTLEVAQGVAWLRVEERKSPPTMDANARTSLESELTQKSYDAWLEDRKRALKVEILRPDLKGPRPSPFTVTMSSGN